MSGEVPLPAPPSLIPGAPLSPAQQSCHDTVLCKQDLLIGLRLDVPKTARPRTCSWQSSRRAPAPTVAEVSRSRYLQSITRVSNTALMWDKWTSCHRTSIGRQVQPSEVVTMRYERVGKWKGREEMAQGSCLEGTPQDTTSNLTHIYSKHAGVKEDLFFKLVKEIEKTRNRTKS